MTPFTNKGMPRWLALGFALLLSFSALQTGVAQDSTPNPGDTEITSQLPAADLPSMNEQGFLFELESSWSGSFDNVPSEAPVYRMELPTFDTDSTSQMAGRLGIEGDVEDLGGNSYSVTGDGGSLFVTPDLQQFVSGEEVPEGDLPGDEQAIAYAREWLRQSQLLPADAGEGTIIARVDDPARVIVSITPVRPENLLSAYPNITVTMGPNAFVVEATFHWANLSNQDVYSLRPVQDAWQEVAEKRSSLQVEVPGDVAEPGSTITGTAEYSQVIISYTTSGIPGEAQFLQPVYVFTGNLTIEGSDTSYPISAYVPALVNSQQPVG